MDVIDSTIKGVYISKKQQDNLLKSGACKVQGPRLLSNRPRFVLSPKIEYAIWAKSDKQGRIYPWQLIYFKATHILRLLDFTEPHKYNLICPFDSRESAATYTFTITLVCTSKYLVNLRTVFWVLCKREMTQSVLKRFLREPALFAQGKERLVANSA